MARPLVTIAVPAFKALYLEQCLQSALAQTYPNVELIVVDDCSDEPIGSIVERVGCGRIRYFRNTENIGRAHPTRNWNRCLALARGDWFCLLGDDDLYRPLFVERAMAAATAVPKVDLVRAGICVIDGDGSPSYEVLASVAHEDWLTFLWERVCNDRRLFASENMIRTSVLRDLGGYIDFPVAWCSDDATLLALSHANGVANVRDALVCWRDSTTNLSTTATASARLYAIDAYRRWLSEHLSQWAEGEPQVKERIEWLAISTQLASRWSSLRVDVMARSWTALRDGICGSDRALLKYPRPNPWEIILSTLLLLKRTVWHGFVAVRSLHRKAHPRTAPIGLDESR